MTLDQLQEQGGVTAISVLENGQHVYVITDPSRLEALQVSFVPSLFPLKVRLLLF